MIQIKNIIKNYKLGDNEVQALKDISINFRNSEFVSILGPSGCGKTTMLNIIGGLDKYTSGDLIINGTSTKEYKDRDWDTYRNHSVGFVFQSYNLIPHQTVLQNVEIALTLSGVSKSERRQRAKRALEDVGLGDQIHKKPNAMSGGQMQRVAIARALVNNPDIILADEPTGALDTETSVQVMEILKKISKERLVVMVTHNPELAEKYSSRIIKMLDGRITGDSKPYSDEDYQKDQNKKLKGQTEIKKEKRPTMSFWTAFKLSLKNLFTKKGRTALTSFAGSIGIIGIALILAVSQGMTTYINHVQETTLASYPVTLEATTVDLTSLMTSFMNVGKGELTHEKDAVYKDPIIGELVNALSQVQTNRNDLKAFKSYLESEMSTEGTKLNAAVTGVQYTYNLELSIYTQNIDGKIIKSDTNEILQSMLADYMMAVSSSGGGIAGTTTSGTNGMSSSGMMANMMKVELWQEILSGIHDNELINSLVYEQYELIDGGSWPNEFDEIVLIVNENNELDDLTLYALGLLSKEEIDEIIDAAAANQSLSDDNKKWTYEEIKNLEFRSILPADCYKDYDGDGIFTDVSGIDTFLPALYENALKLKVTGIVRPKKDADASLLDSGIGYTSLLTEYIINEAVNSDVVQAQLKNTKTDVITGMPFKSNTNNLSNAEKEDIFRDYVSNLSDDEKAKVYVEIQSILTEQQLSAKTMAYMQVEGLINQQFVGDRAKLQALVVKLISEQMGVAPDSLGGYFDELSDEQIFGLAFGLCQIEVQENYAKEINDYYSSYTTDQLVDLLNEHMERATEVQCVTYYDKVTKFAELSYEENLEKLGYLNINSPSAINLYVSSFENKDVIIEAINEYNAGVTEEKRISYTDYLGIMMSSITTIIDAITYVLIAFVSISLIVSSIMIGVITLISVQERIKEIGILRAIGASKRDVSSMFNAETIIIGFSSGLLGVIATYLLCIPINLILKALTGLANLKAILPIPAAIVLIVISMLLTLISGIIPSRSAAKKDPVVALRTE